MFESLDLFRPQEIYLLADSIEAMVFQVEYTTEGVDGGVHRVAILRFEGRESFRIAITRKRLFITALSGTPEEVYHFRSWRYGDRLPYGYYAPRYVVHDYYAYRLRPPPYGYHYVRVDHDVVLAAIASGIVVSAVFGIFN